MGPGRDRGRAGGRARRKGGQGRVGVERGGASPWGRGGGGSVGEGHASRWGSVGEGHRERGRTRAAGQGAGPWGESREAGDGRVTVGGGRRGVQGEAGGGEREGPGGRRCPPVPEGGVSCFGAWATPGSRVASSLLSPWTCSPSALT